MRANNDQGRVASIVKRARRVATALAPELVEKTIWGSPAGKKRLAKRIVGLLPTQHQTYVEPFAGSGAVLFAKDPVATEAINDADPEIAEAYRLLKHLNSSDLSRLKKMTWLGDRAMWKKLRDAAPKDDVARLHRFLYLTHFSYGRLRGKSYNPAADGKTSTTIDRIEQFAPRLRKVHVYSGDYEKVVRKYDTKSTVHFLDPPYAGYNVAVGESDFDEARFLKLLKSLKGQFLVTYGIRGELPKLVKAEGFNVKQIRPPRTIRAMRGVGGPKVLTTLLISNYGLVEKRLADDDYVVEDWAPDDDAEEVGEAHEASGGEEQGKKDAATEGLPENAFLFEKTAAILKGIDPSDERYVMGIVLEPDVVDAQGDTYSAEEIRGAAHGFMEDFGGLGFMHRRRVNGQVKVLESYIAPTSFSMAEREVKKGTWLLAVRILSDELWEQVRDGSLGGFSIGGSARRVPEPVPPKASSPSGEEAAT